MKKTLWSACAVALLVAPLVVAQDKKPAADKKDQAILTAEEKAAFAKQVDVFVGVAQAGETQKDPLLLLSAVKLMDQLPFDAIAKPDAKDKSTYSRDALLTQAKECATGDAELLAVIGKMADAPEATAVRGHRGHGDGPGYYYDRRYHERRHHCEWIRVCERHRGCEWVCERPRHRY